MEFVLSSSDINRFWKKVIKNKDNKCWMWNAGKDKDGYGQFWLTNKGRSVRAHRISYFLSRDSSITISDFILHSCDNPGCVNPLHLREGSHLDNQKDRVSRKRSAKGSRHSQHKLTEEQVIEIRRRWFCGEEITKISNYFGVNRTTIHNIVRRKTWIHV